MSSSDVELELCKDENSNKIDVYENYIMDAVRTTKNDQRPVFFFQIPFTDEFKICFTHSKKHKFHVFRWSNNTCPLDFYVCQNNEIKEAKKEKEAMSLILEAAELARDTSNENLTIEKKIIKQALNAPVKGNPVGFKSCLEDGVDSTTQHIIIKKRCENEGKTPLHEPEMIFNHFDREELSIDKYSKFNEGNMKKKLKQLNDKLNETQDEHENVLHEDLNESLIGLTLMMRNVTDLNDAWYYQMPYQKSASLHIKRLCRRVVENMNNIVPKGQFFFPTNEEEREIFVEDMKRCYSALMDPPKSNLLAIVFENVDVKVENANLFKMLYVNNESVDVDDMDIEDNSDENNSDSDDENY